MRMLPITEKAYELRQLAQRYQFILLNGLVKSVNNGIEVSQSAKKHTFNEYEKLIDRLWEGNTTELEIKFLQTLPPTSNYVKSQYSGELTGGIATNLPFNELEENGIYMLNSQDATPRRIRHIEGNDFAYIDELEDTNVKLKESLTYERLEKTVLHGQDKDNGIYQALKDTIETCKSKNMSPKEALNAVQKTLIELTANS